MFFQFLLGAFGAYIATSGIRSDVNSISGQLAGANSKLTAIQTQIKEATAYFDLRIDNLESQHEAIYRMTEWGVILQTMQMKNGKYIGDDKYIVVEKKDTTILDLRYRVIEEHYKSMVYRKDFFGNKEYINGQLVHEFVDGVEYVYNLEGTKVYENKPKRGEFWYNGKGDLVHWKLADIEKWFDDEGNLIRWKLDKHTIINYENANTYNLKI